MKLAAINTIGLTGAEILAADLARFPEVLMLPGQNFIQHDGICYRPHDYTGQDADAVFESLYTHHFTRSGHCWAGMTKSMSAELRQRYSKESHRKAFLKKPVEGLTALALFESYARSYAESLSEPVEGKKYFGFFGNNIVVNSPAYPDFREKTVVLNFTNAVDFWLANIGQRMVWDNVAACRFWIVNSLLTLWVEQESKVPFLNIDIREYAADRSACEKRIGEFLEITPPKDSAPVDGFIRFEPRFIEKIEKDAAVMRRIYQDDADFHAAMSLADWSADFLRQPGVPDLLRQYQEFWNSTVHTNFDWIGPIEEEIVERVREYVGFRSRRNASRWFYHECFHLNSDDWSKVTVRLEHFLGSQEEAIELPLMPYYVRIVFSYLSSVCRNFEKRPYSARSLRETSLYRRVTSPEFKARYGLWALEKTAVELEEQIDATEAGIAQFTAEQRAHG